MERSLPPYTSSLLSGESAHSFVKGINDRSKAIVASKRPLKMIGDSNGGYLRPPKQQKSRMMNEPPYVPAALTEIHPSQMFGPKSMASSQIQKEKPPTSLNPKFQTKMDDFLPGGRHSNSERKKRNRRACNEAKEKKREEQEKVRKVYRDQLKSCFRTFGSAQTVLIYPPEGYPLNSVPRVSVSKSSISRIVPGEMLDDAIIDFYCKYLLNEVVGNAEVSHTGPKISRDDIHIFDTFFYKKMAEVESKSKSSQLSTPVDTLFDQLSVFVKNLNIFKKRFLAIPVHSGLHWSLLIVVEPGKVSFGEDDVVDVAAMIENLRTNLTPSIIWMDSLRGNPGPCSVVRRWLNREFIRMNPNFKVEDDKPVFTKRNLPTISLSVPIQENDSDCGIFVLKFLEKFLRGELPALRTNDQEMTKFITSNRASVLVRRRNWSEWFPTDGRKMLLDLVMTLHSKYPVPRIGSQEDHFVVELVDFVEKKNVPPPSTPNSSSSPDLVLATPYENVPEMMESSPISIQLSPSDSKKNVPSFSTPKYSSSDVLATPAENILQMTEYSPISYPQLSPVDASEQITVSETEEVVPLSSPDFSHGALTGPSVLKSFSKTWITKTVIVTVYGLDNAGKTSLLNLILGEREKTFPTVGFSCKRYKSFPFVIKLYDLGGGETIRGIWPCYYAESFGSIFVFDLNDSERMLEARDLLLEISHSAEMMGKPILIVFNKSDLAEKQDFVNREDFLNNLELDQLRCPYHIEFVSSLFDNQESGIFSGLKWIKAAIRRDLSNLRSRTRRDVAQQKEREREEMEVKKRRIDMLPDCVKEEFLFMESFQSNRLGTPVAPSLRSPTPGLSPLPPHIRKLSFSKNESAIETGEADIFSLVSD